MHWEQLNSWCDDFLAIQNHLLNLHCYQNKRWRSKTLNRHCISSRTTKVVTTLGWWQNGRILRWSILDRYCHCCTITCFLTMWQPHGPSHVSSCSPSQTRALDAADFRPFGLRIYIYIYILCKLLKCTYRTSVGSLSTWRAVGVSVILCIKNIEGTLDQNKSCCRCIVIYHWICGRKSEHTTNIPLWSWRVFRCLDSEQCGFAHCFSDVSQNFEST